VTPEFKNAEPAIVFTESGRLTIGKSGQDKKGRSGISVTCDGVSNAKNDNLEHHENTECPRVETEEGTVKETKLDQPEDAADSIVRITARDSNLIPVNSEQFAKQA
jgi:hypothetical protein